MPKVHLTDAKIRSLQGQHGKQVEYWDALVPAFGIRVSAKGKKTWVLMYRAGGRLRRMTLGSYPSLKLGAAREAARQALDEVEKGLDPAAEKAHQRKTRPQSFGELASDYLERHARPNKRRPEEDEDKLEADVLPLWRHRKVESIRRADVIRLIESVHHRGAPIASNRLLALLKAIFNWAIKMDLADTNPADKVKPLAKERARDRCLEDDELKAVWLAAKEMAAPHGPFFQLLILTGQRRTEVAGMRWDELDLEKKVWTLSAERTKSDRVHTVPLSQPCVDVLKRLKRYGSPYVLPKRGKEKEDGGHYIGWGKAKQAIDKASGVSDWRIHDLRRTLSSGLARLGFPIHVGEKVLNHSTGQLSGIVGVYNRYSYEPEKRRALMAWGRFVVSLERKKKTSNVVRLRAG